MSDYRPDDPLPPVDVAGGTWFLKAAYAYSRMGFPLVPNEPGTKKVASELLRQKPEDSDVEWWSYMALTDPDEVLALWTAYPTLQPGLVTGGDRIILDLDVKNGEDPHTEIGKWEAEQSIKLPLCAKVRTPTDGEHWYFRKPAGYPPIESVSGWLPGVDIRGTKGQVILPPSFSLKAEEDQIREHGYVVDSEYCWIDLGGDPYNPTPEEILADLDAAEAPEALIRDILNNGARRTAKRRQKRAGGAGTIDMDGVVRSKDGFIDIEHYEANGIPAGLQERVLLLLATKMGGYLNLPVDEAVERCWAILSKSEQNSSDPWTKYEVNRKVRRQHAWAAKDTQIKRAKQAAKLDEAAALLSNFLHKG
jgi:bifunctional DNA primase/polymerase-like protein